jgi:flagellar motor switch protein FliN/FliY
MNDILRGFGGDSGSSLPPMRDDVRVPGNMDMVLDIRLRATARLGSIEMPLGDVLSFGPGTIIDVGRLVDEPVDLLVNNKLIARGDIVVVDEKYGLRITEIISPRERIESLR